MKRLAIAIGLFVVLSFAVLVVTRPSRFEVVRSVLVPAPPAVAFEKLTALHEWPKWSKWARDRVPKSDALAGPPSGIGASWTWQPAHHEARGGLEIVAVTAPSQVVLKILGDSPAKPQLTFELAPEQSATRVTARFAGDLELLGKLVSIFKSPEAVAGPSLERELGLFAAMVASP